MYKLRLTKARSYRGYGVIATRESPVVEVADAVTAQKLYESGYFDKVLDKQAPEPGQRSGQATETGPEPESVESASGNEAEEDGVEPESEPDYDALSAMTKAELTAYATERGIDLTKCKTKGDILTAISMAFGGSPTMIDLQREPGNEEGDGV